MARTEQEIEVTDEDKRDACFQSLTKTIDKEIYCLINGKWINSCDICPYNPKNRAPQ